MKEGERLQVSHSRIETFKNCPFKFKLSYVDELKTLKPDDADNALFLGTALHTGIEKGVDEALQEYFNQYPVITDLHINEAMKLEVMIPKAKRMLPRGEFEVKIEDEDFKGFIDLLVPVDNYTFDIYDFKYSNNTSHYEESAQVHLYKYFFEKLNLEMKVRNLYYLCVPKVNIRQKKTEELHQFRQRIHDELMNAEPQLIQVEYDPNKVIDWMFNVKHTVEAESFPKNESWLCKYCEFKDYCERGLDYMLLPKNERRNIEVIEKKVVWLYGSPFSGKTTFANHFPDPLMLNTDGNIKFVDAPYIAIKDRIEKTGRQTNKTLAWDVFKEVIDELEKKDNDFKTIIVDLLEDTYEYCRLWMYDQMGITHESDDSFRAWDKVRTEFLSTLKRLMALDYENIILISHEDSTKDITKKGGDKLTSIKPNLQDKVANKVAGMVDIVARVIADDSNRVLSFKNNEVIFGGGRLKTTVREIPLKYDEFLKVYVEANGGAEKTSYNAPEEAKASNDINTKEQGEESHTENYISSDDSSEPEEEKPKTRTRRTRKERE
jgi:phage nucleotide-binding protein